MGALLRDHITRRIVGAVVADTLGAVALVGALVVGAWLVGVLGAALVRLGAWLVSDAMRASREAPIG